MFTATLPQCHCVHSHSVTVSRCTHSPSHCHTAYTVTETLSRCTHSLPHCHTVTVYTLTVAQSLCAQLNSQSLCHTVKVTVTLSHCNCVHSHTARLSLCAQPLCDSFTVYTLTVTLPHCVHSHSHSVTVYTLIATMSRCTHSKSHSLCHL